MGGETRWLTYEDMGVALGITSESAKRLAMRHKWPRRPGNDGRALVAVPEERLEEAAQAIPAYVKGDDADDDTPVILLEQNDKWQLQHRYMTLETMAGRTDQQPATLTHIAP